MKRGGSASGSAQGARPLLAPARPQPPSPTCAAIQSSYLTACRAKDQPFSR